MATCRICLEEGDLITPCKCKGTTAHIHVECLERWLDVSNASSCEICGAEYKVTEYSRFKCRCKYIRRFTCSSHPQILSSILSFGVFFFFILHLIALLVYYDWMFTCVATLVVQLVLVVVLADRIHSLSTLAYWRIMSSMSNAVAAYNWGIENFIYADIAVTSIVVLVCIIYNIKTNCRDHIRSYTFNDGVHMDEP